MTEPDTSVASNEPPIGLACRKAGRRDRHNQVKSIESRYAVQTSHTPHVTHLPFTSASFSRLASAVGGAAKITGPQTLSAGGGEKGAKTASMHSSAGPVNRNTVWCRTQLFSSTFVACTVSAWNGNEARGESCMRDEQ